MATADDSRFYSEHDDRVGPRRRRKGRGPFRAPLYSEQMSKQRHHGGGGGAGPRSRFEDDDGDVTMTDDVHDGGLQRRFNPYGRSQNRRNGRRGGKDTRGDGGNQGGRGNRGGGGSGGGGGGAASADAVGGRKNWFKITIPHGKKYEKQWLLSSLRNICTMPFCAIQYHTEGNRVQFYIEDSTTAYALSKVSRRITDKDGFKVAVLLNPCQAPSLPQQDLKLEDLEHLKQCMSKRFDGSQQALDLNNIRVDPDLVSLNIEVALGRKNSMQAVIKIIEENIPELVCLNLSNNRLYRLDDLADLIGKVPNLKILNLSHNEIRSERELDKLKGLRLVELSLQRNPLCDHFNDQADYIRSTNPFRLSQTEAKKARVDTQWRKWRKYALSIISLLVSVFPARRGLMVSIEEGAVRERFPRLLKLDGHDLPPPIGFDLEVAPAVLPPCKPSYFGSEELKGLIMCFLQQYYTIYDSADRQPLLDAYHDGATFSLIIPSSTQNPSRSGLGEYQKDSRNIKRVKDATTRFRLLKHTRLNVVAFLNELPKTQHDIASFNVDVNTYTSTLLSFTVSGVFKEADGSSRDLFRAFSRVFIAVSPGNGTICIVNDEMFIRNATTEEIRRAFVAPAPTPSSSPVPTLSATQQEMLSAFSQQSGMNLEWSQKCLQDNDWNFERAGQIFTDLKAQGKIPDVAFIK